MKVLAAIFAVLVMTPLDEIAVIAVMLFAQRRARNRRRSIP